MTDFLEQVPERTNTSTAISRELAAIQERLRRAAASTDPGAVGGLRLPVLPEGAYTLPRDNTPTALVEKK